MSAVSVPSASAFRSLFNLTLRELQRTRWPLLLALLVGLAAGAAKFAAALPLLENDSTRLVLYAALARFAVVGAYALLVLANLIRDADDRTLELFLSRPVARTHFVCARFTGYLVGAVLSSGAVALPMIGHVPAAGLAVWTLSLASELTVMTAAAFACALSLGQVLAGFTATLGFYVLARSTSTLVLLGTGPLGEGDTVVATGFRWGTQFLGILLPDLGRSCDARWLLGSVPDIQEWFWLAADSLLFSGVLLLLGLMDFRRRAL